MENKVRQLEDEVKSLRYDLLHVTAERDTLEKKNTMENLTKEQAIDFLREYAKCGIYHNYMHDKPELQKLLKKMNTSLEALAASGSVAAPKEEETIIQKSIISFLLGEDSYDGYWWGQEPHDRRPPFWWRTKLREEIERARKAISK